MNAHTAFGVATELQTQKFLTLLELSKAIASHRDLSGLFHDLTCRLRNLFCVSRSGGHAARRSEESDAVLHHGRM